MPKVKTKKIAVKRFKISKGGKLLHRTQGIRHLRQSKNKTQKRRTGGFRQITNTKFARVIKQFLTA